MSASAVPSVDASLDGGAVWTEDGRRASARARRRTERFAPSVRRTLWRQAAAQSAERRSSTKREKADDGAPMAVEAFAEESRAKAEVGEDGEEEEEEAAVRALRPRPGEAARDAFERADFDALLRALEAVDEGVARACEEARTQSHPLLAWPPAL